MLWAGTLPDVPSSQNALQSTTSMCTPSNQILLGSHSFKSTSSAVRDALARVAKAVAAVGHKPGTVGNIELALAEVLNNVVEHSFHDQSNGEIQLIVVLLEQEICISIRHSGAPMPGLSLPIGNPVDLAVDRASLPEGGFGWFLIRSLTTTIGYTHHEDWNQLNLYFQL
jgi:serine/threonine-protein kinase RsbW